MNTYQHYVVGFFADRTQAKKTVSKIIAQGISQKAVQVFDKYSVLPIIFKEDAASDGFAGSVIESFAGTGLSALVEVKLIANKVSLIVEQPLIPQLVALGWASILGVVDMNFYTRDDTRLLSDLVHDAVLSKQIVVAIETCSERETYRVADIIHAAVGDLSDVN